MSVEDRKMLVVGLGNPGKKYALTRHNLGLMVLDAFAKKHGLTFKKERELKGEVAKGPWEGGKVFLLFPTTYMNLSGSAVRKTLDFYRIALEDLLVISDDAALPFGICRFKERGSSGGHNGLKDIEQRLGTREYQRLKMGVGEPLFGDLEDHVLAPFTKEEQEKIPEIAAEGVTFLEEWLSREKRKETNE